MVLRSPFSLAPLVLVSLLELVAAPISGCSAPPSQPSVLAVSSLHRDPFDPQVVAVIKDRAIPFETSKPGSGLDDLAPLADIIGDARIVALGEATHGTREFLEMKHRLVEFLVGEMNFDLVAIEANWPEAASVNRYVQTGDGDPAQLLSSLHAWPFNTQEVLDMVQWMRQYNADSSRPPVSLHGFDMQFPHAAIDEVIAYVREVDPAFVDIESAYSCYRTFQDATFGYANARPPFRQQCRSELLGAHSTLLSQRQVYEQRSSPAEFEQALQNSRLVLQAEERYSSISNRDLRDRFMAENVAWLLEHSDASSKIVLWAHNSHVSASLPVAKSMGTYLREQYGNDMVVIGFDFFKGSFNAAAVDTQLERQGALSSHNVPPPPEDSYEALFHNIGLPRLYLDLRVASDWTGGQWIQGPHPFRSIGATFDSKRPEDYFYNARLADEYDVIFYFEETWPSTLLSLQ